MDFSFVFLFIIAGHHYTPGLCIPSTYLNGNWRVAFLFGSLDDFGPAWAGSSREIDSIYEPHEAVILMLIFKYIHLIASSLRIASKKLVSINASLFLSVW